MGCAPSKQDEEDNVVSLCRERKRLLKLAVERRYAFADAQYKYNQSLYGVAMALRLFVARHSTPSSPFLITFPSTATTIDLKQNLVCNSNFHQQRPSEATHETISYPNSVSKVSLMSSQLGPQKPENQKDSDSGSEESEEETEDGEEICSHFYGSEEEEEEDRVCDHFYDEVSPLLPSPQREFGWDFFNPFDEVRTEEVKGFSRSSDEDLRAVREKEGIPELEEDGERVKSEHKGANVKNGDVGHKESGVGDLKSGGGADAGVGESKCLRMMDTPTNERELLEALKDIEDHFVRAYDSGLEISRMLEANRVQMPSSLEEIKGGFLFCCLLDMLFVVNCNSCLHVVR